MRIALLSNGRSVHTIRWANGLAERGHDVHLFTVHPLIEPTAGLVSVHRLSPRAPWGYVLAARALRQQLAALRPDLLHAHYASGYGTLARLTDFHPLVLSVWGTDVYEFPHRTPLHRALFVANLARADKVLSTSHAMAEEIRRVWPKVGDLTITPFGVDTKQFAPPLSRGREGEPLTIGTVKTLEPRYGLDVLLKGFSEAWRAWRDSHGGAEWRLVVAGTGSQEGELRALAADLGIAQQLGLPGHVPNPRVPKLLSTFDVFVAVSRSESFGVSVLEASACGIPVIVSDVGGLPEVVDNGHSGYVVDSESPSQLAEKLLMLAEDAGLRQKLGQCGRAFVTARYDWSHSIDIMEKVYLDLV